jgi:penicillin-binding protein 2
MVFSLLLIRLVDVEIVNGEHFFTLAENNRYFTKKSPAERAVFLDRYGQALVRNEKQYFKYLKKDQLYSDKEFLAKEEALALLATDSANLAYEFNRVYPYKESLSSVLGYISPVTENDLKKDFSLPISNRIGRMGLEQFFDKNLQSEPALSKFETNALGQKQRLVSYTAPVYSSNIQTSLDPYLSELVYQAMAGKKGAVVIMDASNGEILTLISSPSFDANVFEENFINSLYKRDSSESMSKIKEYLSDENKVFFNRSVAGAYPPGSIFKLVTAIGALQEGAIDENTIVEDDGTLKVGDFEYANWYFTQYGRTEGAISVKRALARSNDIFFYKAAEWLGPTKLAEYARLFGFGSPTGLQLSQEVAGLVPDPKWKETELGESWYLGNTYHFGIGQGDLLVTPVQIANMTQAIANQGTLCQGSLLPISQQNCRDLAIDEKNLEIVLSGMLGACSQGGTAYPLFPYNTELASTLSEEDFSDSQKIDQGMIACKTGTAEFGAADERGYRKTHAWMTAILGVDQEKILNAEIEAIAASEEKISPNRAEWAELVRKNGFPKKIVITVLVESNEDQIFSEGSQDAAPVIAKVLDWMF